MLRPINGLVLLVASGLILLGIALFVPSLPWDQDAPTINHFSADPHAKATTREIHLFTVEHQANHNGNKVEVYRFDPGAITVVKGEKIRLHIHGFHGKEHHFSIPAFHVENTVTKGRVSIIEFVPHQTGTFEIICHNHLTEQREGPMIGYITVVPS